MLKCAWCGHQLHLRIDQYNEAFPKPDLTFSLVKNLLIYCTSNIGLLVAVVFGTSPGMAMTTAIRR